MLNQVVSKALTRPEGCLHVTEPGCECSQQRHLSRLVVMRCGGAGRAGMALTGPRGCCVNRPSFNARTSATGRYGRNLPHGIKLVVQR